MKKILIALLFISTLISVILIFGVFYKLSVNDLTYEQIYNKERPKIVSHFACSDYCPGDQSKYAISIYEGVTDSDECNALGGSIYEYTGWGTTRVCRVN